MNRSIAPYGFPDLAEMLWRRKAAFGGCLIGALLLGSVVTSRTPPVFRARARVSVAAPPANPVVVRSAEGVPESSDVILGDTLATRAELLRSSDLHQRARESAGAVEQPGVVPSRITVQEHPHADMLDVIVEGGDREEIALLANRVVELHLADEKGTRATGMGRAIELLRDERRRVEAEIGRLETRLSRPAPSPPPVEGTLSAETLAQLIQECRSRVAVLRSEVSAARTSGTPALSAPQPSGLTRLLWEEEARLTELLEKQGRLEAQPPTPGVADGSVGQREVLTGRKNAMQARLTQVETNLRELETRVESLASTARLAEPATVPLDPVYPVPAINLAISLLLGSLIGIAVGVARDSAGYEPPESEWRRLRLPVLFSLARPRMYLPGEAGDLSTARHIADACAQAGLANEPRLLLTGPGCGQTLFGKAWQLAEALAVRGNRVLLIDADIGRGPGHRNPLLDPPAGVSGLLCGLCDQDEALIPIEEISLTLLPSGGAPPNGVQLLRGARFEAVLADLEERYDQVLVSVPWRPVPELASTLSRVFGRTILLAPAGLCRPRELARIAAAVEAEGSLVMGVVRYAPAARLHRHMASPAHVQKALPDLSGGPSPESPSAAV